jgi:tetratricopeptide (TPR) repeat protein
MKMLF